MRTRFALAITAAVLSFPAAARQRPAPVIDMHMHALKADSQGPPPLAMCTPFPEFPAWDPGRQPYTDVFLSMARKPACADPVWSPKTDGELRDENIAVVRRRNIIGVLGGDAAIVDEWMAVAPDRFIPSLGVSTGDRVVPDPAFVRARHAAGRLRVLGEMAPQYSGMMPDDPRLESYWALAEELDIPVGIHIGTGPPGAPYLGTPRYRARLHSPLTLEEVLRKHPKLRVYVMHAGFPMLDDMLAVLYAHPQVYVDTGVIVYTQPKAAFYRYLQAIVDAGFGTRVMFGSDQMVWPGVIERAITVIEEAPFLTPAQKRGILYDNAARFLRLSNDEIKQHHGTH